MDTNELKFVPLPHVRSRNIYRVQVDLKLKDAPLQEVSFEVGLYSPSEFTGEKVMEWVCERWLKDTVEYVQGMTLFETDKVEC